MMGRIALALTALLAAGSVQDIRSPRPAVQSAPGRCVAKTEADTVDQALSPSRSVYCMEFVPTGDFSATGMGELRHVASSPFTVSVDAAGHPLYELDISLAGLPDPGSIGPYTAYVAWAITSTLDEEVKLGEVRNGRTAAGIVRFNRFAVMITAERSALVTKRAGRPVLNATSPSWQLQAHDDIAVFGRGGMGMMMDMHGDMPALGWVSPPMHPRVSLMAPGHRWAHARCRALASAARAAKVGSGQCARGNSA